MKPQTTPRTTYSIIQVLLLHVLYAFSTRILFSNFLLLNLFYNFLFAERSKRVCEWKKVEKFRHTILFAAITITLHISRSRITFLQFLCNLFKSFLTISKHLFLPRHFFLLCHRLVSARSQCYRRFCAPHTGALAYLSRSIIKSTTSAISVLYPVFPYRQS